MKFVSLSWETGEAHKLRRGQARAGRGQAGWTRAALGRGRQGQDQARPGEDGRVRRWDRARDGSTHVWK